MNQEGTASRHLRTDHAHLDASCRKGGTCMEIDATHHADFDLPGQICFPIKARVLTKRSHFALVEVCTPNIAATTEFKCLCDNDEAEHVRRFGQI